MADICSKIQPPKDGLYQGAFTPDPRYGDRDISTEKSIGDFEQMSGAEVDIALKFLAFTTGLNFPMAEASASAKKGGTIFIKLEPWSWRGKDDKSFTLENILNGKYDHLLKRFAEGAKKFGKPVFVSFGHEMNGTWYPWSGDPELYKKAFHYVHDKISQEYGACNVTWVWNPDIISSARSYYPGDKYVDWIGIDGYNTEDYGNPWKSCSELFSERVAELESLRKPLMIGEFGSDANNPTDEKERKPAWLSECIDYFAREKKVKAYIYLNKNKVEEGKAKKWAIDTPDSKRAYGEAVRKHDALFRGRIQGAEGVPAAEDTSISKPTPSTKPLELGAPASLPPGFSKGSLSPRALIDKNKGKIKGSKGRMTKYKTKIDVTQGIDFADENRKLKSYRSGIFMEYILQWMFERENGNPRPDLLKDSLNYAGSASPYWRTKIAFLIASGNPDRSQIDYIKGLFPKNDRIQRITSLSSKAEKFSLIEKLYKFYTEKKTAEGTDLLLKGEMDLQLATLASKKSLAKEYFKKAYQDFQEIINNPKKENKNKVYQAIESRSSYLKEEGHRKSIDEEFDFYQSQAPLLKAQVLLFKAGDETDPAKALGNLLNAYNTLKGSTKFLEGLHFQQVKRLAAECLIRIGFILKDYGKNPDILKQVNPLLHEIFEWLKSAGIQSPIDYQNLFITAQALIKGVPNESVFDWEKAYRNEWKKEYKKSAVEDDKLPLWMKQISIYTKLWLVKMKMVEAGEIKDGMPKDFIKLQREKLIEAGKTLDEIIPKTDVLNTEGMAEVKKTLAENLARQAFILLDLGDSEYLKLFAEAESRLVEAINEGNEEVKVEAELWLAKIYLVEAGKIESKKERENLLHRGLSKLDKCFGKDDQGNSLLKGTVLSSAYQTRGDLLSALKRFNEAKDALEAALRVFPRNFFAEAALGDVLNWQGNHTGAIRHYGLVPPTSPAYPRARLGLTESTMRLNEVYSSEAIKELEERAKEIFSSEAPASPLTPRAIQSLIEAYRTDEDLQNRIVYIGKKLLGIEAEVNLEEAEEKSLDDILDKITEEAKATFETKFKAEIYLRTAEALLWGKKFNAALALLNKMPSEFNPALQNTPELQVLKGLIEAEARMRKEKEAQPFLDFLDNSHPAQIAIEEKDPDLAERIVLGLIEAHSLEKEWDKAIEAAQNPVISLEKMRGLFGDRKLGYEKFRFRIQFRLVEAFIGNKDFAKAEEELKKILIAAQEVKDKRESYLSPLAERTRAEAYLLLGNLYSYRWADQNFNESKNNYEKTSDLMKDKDSSKEGKIILTKAYRGLGEIYRYGEKLRSYERSKDYYQQAIEVAQSLPRRSDNRRSLLSRIYLGLAKLEQQENNRKQAVIYFEEAKKHGRGLPDSDELQSETDRTGAFLKDHYIKLENQSFFDGNSRMENRFLLEGQFPLFKGTLVPSLSYQLDEASGLAIHNFYFGAKLRPLEIFDVRSHALTLEGKFKLYEKNAYSNPLAEMKYFRQHDAIGVLSYSNKWFSLVGSAAFYSKDSAYNSYYANFTANLTPRLQLGGEWNRYLFTLSGERNIRDDYNLALRFNVDLADLFLDHYDQAKLRLSLAYPYSAFQNGTSLYDPKSFKAGMGLDIHLGKGIVLTLDCALINQKDYSYGLCATGVRW